MNKFNSTCSFVLAYFSFFALRISLIFLFITYVSSRKKSLRIIPFMLRRTISPWKNIYFYVLQFNSLSSVIPSEVNFVNGMLCSCYCEIQLFYMVYYCSCLHVELSWRKGFLLLTPCWRVDSTHHLSREAGKADTKSYPNNRPLFIFVKNIFWVLVICDFWLRNRGNCLMVSVVKFKFRCGRYAAFPIKPELNVYTKNTELYPHNWIFYGEVKVFAKVYTSKHN